MGRAQVLNNQEIIAQVSILRRVSWFAFKWGAVLAATTSGIVWGSYQVVRLTEVATAHVQQLKRDVRERLTLIEVRQQFINAEEVPLPTLTKEVSDKRGVPYVVLRAVVEQESSGGAFVYRFEDGVYSRLKQKFSHLPDSEIRMLASSHGVAQVMGYNAEARCGVHWSKLYQAGIGLDCGAQILRENLDKHAKESDTSRRIWLALRDYNGSGKQAEEYANEVMAKIGSLALESVNG